MAIRVTTDVFCDDCGCWVHGGVSHRIAAKDARSVAAKEGWVYKLRIRDEGNKMVDLCSECAAGVPKDRRIGMWKDRR